MAMTLQVVDLGSGHEVSEAKALTMPVFMAFNGSVDHDLVAVERVVAKLDAHVGPEVKPSPLASGYGRISPWSSDGETLLDTPDLKGLDDIDDNFRFVLDPCLAANITGISANGTEGGQYGLNKLGLFMGEGERFADAQPRFTRDLYADSVPVKKDIIRGPQEPIGTPSFMAVSASPAFSLSSELGQIDIPVASTPVTTSICSLDDEIVYTSEKRVGFGAIVRPPPKTEDEIVHTRARGEFGPIGRPAMVTSCPTPDVNQQVDFYAAYGTVQCLAFCSFTLQDSVDAAIHAMEDSLVNQSTGEDFEDKGYSTDELIFVHGLLDELLVTLKACNDGINNFVAATNA